MKKESRVKTTIYACMLAVFAVFCCLAPFRTVRADASSESLVMQLVEKHSSDQIDIDVRMVTNTGVAGMTLELVYDRNAFEYLGYKEGTALAGLDLIATKLGDDDTLPVKFNWLHRDGELKNDESVGTVMTLSFKLKENVPSGKYDVGFRYNRNGDIIYFENEVQLTKSAAIGKAVISVEGDEISGAEIVDDDPQGGNEGKADGEKKDGINGWLIVGIVAGSVSIAALATVLVLKIMSKKRGKGNWSEI